MPIFFRDSENLPGGRSRRQSSSRYATVKVEGWEQIQKKLNVGWIFGHGVLRGAMVEGTETLYGAIVRWAPWGRGVTAARVNWDVEPGDRPSWGRVDMKNMPTRKGFRYPGALEGSRRIRFKYRSGPHEGKFTRGWFSRGKGRASRAITRIFQAAGQAVQRHWDRG